MKVGDNAITCVGYTNMESRMGATASYLFGGNITNFLLSMENKETKEWNVNLEDPAVRSICVALEGKALEPYVPPPPPVAAVKPKTAEEEAKENAPPLDPKQVNFTD